jgi:hypothetical protein
MWVSPPQATREGGELRLRGYSAVEALLALLLTAVAVQAAWSVAAHQGRAARVTMDRVELMEVRRTVGWILQEELRASVRGVDWKLHGTDSVSLRAFRGTGMICPPGAGRELTVLGYGGMRIPNPEKDSVLVLQEDGRWVAVGLVGRTPSSAPCPAAPRLTAERWTVSDSLNGAVLGRVFERGAYHLAGDAFRYSRGGGGRQPLTPLRLVTEESGFRPLPAGFGWLLTTQLPGSAGTRSRWEGRLWALEGEG